jgi:hypothetical protein
MSNIQKTLDALQPYVVGIRYVEGVPVIDAVFKEGWAVQPDQTIKTIKGDESLNYFMVYSDTPNIGVDELLGFVSKTIKMNQEREKKHELLKLMVEELKNIFKQNSLEKLTRLKFSFADEELVPKLNDFDLNIDDEFVEEEIIIPQPQKDVIIVTDPDSFNGYSDYDTQDEINGANHIAYVDENGNPIEYSEEELEMLEEEARAERNKKYLDNKKPKSNRSKIELPPK